MELLSPAGSIDALKMAVKNGANAVYLGLECFNARMKAENFTSNNIGEWVDYCHIRGVKVYVTLNISIKESELDSLSLVVASCESAGVDAFIITDLSILPLAQQLAPHVELHASTQLGVHNLYGAMYLERLGFSRVVLSRECTMAEVSEIKEKTSLEVEYFVHGAMCVSFSGGCLFSSISTGNSGNRGQCLQPCRKEYTESLTDSKGYLLSPKDQCLIENLSDLAKSGVDSLKIEGRMKSPEYVGIVVSKYRKTLDNEKINSNDYSDMKRAFNRGGFSQGYAFSQKNELMCKSVQGHIGEQVAQIIDVQKRKDHYRLTVKSNHPFVNGDGVKVLRNGREVGGFEVSVVSSRNNEFVLYSKKPFEVKDKLHITFDKQLTEKILSVSDKKLKISVFGQVSLDEVDLTAVCGECSFNYKRNASEFNIEEAKNQSLSKEDFVKCFAKCGDYPFELDVCSVEILGELFVTKGNLNAVRRAIYDGLVSQLLVDIRTLKNNEKLSKIIPLKSRKIAEFVVCNPSFNEVDRLAEMNVDFVIDSNKIKGFITKYALIKNNIYVKLPKIQLFDDFPALVDLLRSLPENIGIYADNVYALEIARQENRYVLGGIGLNIFNRNHAKILGINSYIASPELNLSEINDLTKDNNSNVGVYAFGYLPVMTFVHCPVQNITGCTCDTCKYKSFSLSDKFGEYAIRREKYNNCYFNMYNSACHNLSTMKELANYTKFLDFSIYDGSSTEVIDSFIRGIKVDFDTKYTTGHISRGVK